MSLLSIELRNVSSSPSAVRIIGREPKLEHVGPTPEGMISIPLVGQWHELLIIEEPRPIDPGCWWVGEHHIDWDISHCVWEIIPAGVFWLKTLKWGDRDLLRDPETKTYHLRGAEGVGEGSDHAGH